jgi:3-hydroxyacyl-CoA dehydrogenase
MLIQNICVLGAGLMGHGIAQVCAQAGYRVALRVMEGLHQELGDKYRPAHLTTCQSRKMRRYL